MRRHLGVNRIDPNLLNELRIEGREREQDAATPRWIWPAVAAVVVVALLAGAGWWFFLGRPVAVRTVDAIAPTGAAGAGAVLQATGYVTARRQATVSTQITGTLTKVLIEEGMHVKEGQVIAQLED
jgi:multidrug efflux pump subunit AcrA (membrane-fusion protein)